MRNLLQERTVALRAKVDATMQNTKVRHQLGYDWRTHERHSSKQEPYVSADNPATQTARDASVGALAKHTHKKL